MKWPVGSYISDWNDPDERYWCRVEGEEDWHIIDFSMVGPRYTFMCKRVTWEKVLTHQHLPSGTLCSECLDNLKDQSWISQD